ncbi:TPA: hypothetical protein ACH3X2_005744 [Trebouxia sp. C0005]
MQEATNGQSTTKRMAEQESQPSLQVDLLYPQGYHNAKTSNTPYAILPSQVFKRRATFHEVGVSLDTQQTGKLARYGRNGLLRFERSDLRHEMPFRLIGGA